jgi:hypothetical protein
MGNCIHRLRHLIGTSRMRQRFQMRKVSGAAV